ITPRPEALVLTRLCSTARRGGRQPPQRATDDRGTAMKFEKIDQWFANAQDIPELRATLPEPLFATQHEADEFDRLFDDFLNAGPGRDGLTDQDIDHMRVKFRALVPMRVL